MSFNAFSNSMMFLILTSFIVERSLAVIFETRFYIQRFGANKQLKPMIAIGYGIIFVVTIDINIAEIIRQGEGGVNSLGYDWARDTLGIAHNCLIIFITGIFIAGGSKASLKLFRDVWNIKSADEAMRTTVIKPAPANALKAVDAAAMGNTEAENMLYNLFNASEFPKAS